MAHQQQVCRAGDEEASRRTAAVDCSLHGAKQLGFALYLVERHRFAASDQNIRIAPGGIEHVEFVERLVAPATARQVFGERTLASLPRTGQDDGWHDRKPLPQGTAHQSRKGLHIMDDRHSRNEWSSLPVFPWSVLMGTRSARLGAKLPWLAAATRCR